MTNVIPNNILDIVLGEDYNGDYTLRDELISIGEDIETVDCKLDNNGLHFICWTKSYVCTLAPTGFGDEMIIKLKRNP